MRFIDQIADVNLTKFSCMFGSMLPENVMHHSLDMEDILPLLFENDGLKMIFDMPTQSATKVVDTPDGKALIRMIRGGHGEILSKAFPEGYAAPETEFDRMVYRDRLPKVGLRFALNDQFPVGDPKESVLSLIYALGQKKHLGGNYDIIRKQVVDTVGKTLVDEIEFFVDALKKGIGEFVDTESGKRIVVTVEDYLDDVQNLNSSDTSVKTAALKNAYIRQNPYRARQAVAMLKKSGMTQTSLVKLSQSLRLYAGFDGVKKIAALLKEAIIKSGSITVNNPEEQRLLLEKLGDIFKGIPGVNEDFIHNLVYNTSIPLDSEPVLWIEGYPVDKQKMDTLTYDQALPALTQGVVDLIFDDAHVKIDEQKLRDFMKMLLDNNNRSESEMEEIKDRIVKPIMSALEPDEDLAEDIGAA